MRQHSFWLLLYVQLVSIYHAIIQHVHECSLQYSLYIALPLCVPTSSYLAPSSCDRNGPSQFQVACKLSPLSPIAPHCSPLLPCIHPSWVFPDPNVLSFRTHPNPSPSERNSPPRDASITIS